MIFGVLVIGVGIIGGTSRTSSPTVWILHFCLPWSKGGVNGVDGGIGILGGSMDIKFACKCSPHPSATHPPSPLEKAKGVDFVFLPPLCKGASRI